MNIIAKNILPVTKVKQDLMRLLKQVQSDGEPVLITRDGKAAAVLLSNDEYESLLETCAIMRDKKTLAALKKAENSLKKGKRISHKEVFS